MNFWEYLGLFLTAFIGGTASFFVSRDKWGTVQVLIAFSGAFLLALAVVHLIPGLWGSGVLPNPGLWVLAGFALQLLLEPLSKGIEHGHFHAVKSTSVWPVMIGLFVHAFLEGMPLSGYPAMEGAAFHAGHGNRLLWGILVHKAPAGFALGSLLRLSGMSRLRVVAMLGVFAMASPLGALIAAFSDFSMGQLFFLLAMVTGSFLHLSTSILFESNEEGGAHKVSWKKFGAILAGFALAVLSA
jgi:zinc transporter ZupT